jgi:hypothetical protein
MLFKRSTRFGNPRHPVAPANRLSPGSPSWRSSPGGEGPSRNPDLRGIGIDPLCGGEIPLRAAPANVQEELTTPEVFNSPVASKRVARGDFATSFPIPGSP